MTGQDQSIRAAGFTLIELLVVISIIALLVGILLPALGAARESARGLVCQTHMKNLSTAHVAYAADHKAFWPGWSIYSNTTRYDTGSWIPYASMTSPVPGTEEDLTRGDLWPYTPDLGVFKCPSDEFAHLSSGLSYSISHHVYQPPTRAVSPNNYAAADWPANPATRPEYLVEPAVAVTLPQAGVQIRYPNSDKFVQPSNLIFLVDEGGPALDVFPGQSAVAIGVNDGLFQNLYSPLPGGNSNFNLADKTKWYHSRSAAFGFADGHGELRKEDDKEVISYSLMQRTSTGRFFPYGRIWDPAAQAPEIAQ
ncbi:MAG: hypothetical protein Kow00105_09210 [Phycisphaeraceae bacterium]